MKFASSIFCIAFIHSLWRLHGMQNTAEAVCSFRQSRRFAIPAKLRRMTDAPGQSVVLRGAEEFKKMYAASGRTQQETADYLSRRLGRSVEHYTVSRYASGKTKVPVDVMDAMRELAAQPVTSASVVTPLTESSDVVPLFGYANAAGAVLRLNEDQRVGVVPIHPAQKGSRSAFAFIVFGDSLSPRLQHGDVAYAVRNRIPHKGEPVLIEMKDGEALVKIFARMDDRTLFGTQLSPKKDDLSWPLRDVSGIHAVVGVSFGR